MIGLCAPALRFAAAPWLAAFVLVLSACESPQLPPWMQERARPGPPAATTPAPATPEPQTPTPPASAYPTYPGVDRPELAPRPEAASPGQTPSLAPLLARRPPPEGSAPAAPAVPAPPPAQDTSVRVALLLPLSGPNAPIGTAMLNAVQLALFDWADERFELLPYDTGTTPEGAIEAAQFAIGDGARLILGPLLASGVRVVAPSARAAGVPVVAFSSDRTVASGGVFTMGFLPSAEVRRVVGYARSRGLTRFAALAPDNEYGATVVAALREAAAAGGGTVTRVQFYDPSAVDFSSVVRHLADYDSRRHALAAQTKALEGRDDELSKRALARLEKLHTLGELPFDALLLPDGGKRLQSIAALLPFYDIDPNKVRVLGTGQWDEPGLGAEPALVGGWFAAPAPETRAVFESRFQQVYGVKPPRLATLAYDAGALAAVLAKAQGGPKFTVEALTASGGFWGSDGVFRFLKDGTAERGLAVLQVGTTNRRTISKAPETFGPATN